MSPLVFVPSCDAEGVTLTRRSLLQLITASTAGSCWPGCCWGSTRSPTVESISPLPPPSPTTSVAPARFDPARTFVLSISVLSFAHEDMFPSFPIEGRRDDVLDATFLARGVPPNQCVRVRDAEATREGILRIASTFLARVPEDADVVFYYAGHGYRDDAGSTYFAAHDTGEDAASGVRHDEILRLFAGRRALFLIDCCFSGALGAEVLRAHAAQRFAVLASSLASEISTGAWTFTDAVIEGFEGAARCDTDHDGTITLANVAEFAESELAFTDGQLATYARTESFPRDFVIARAAPMPCARFGEHVEVRWERRWWPATIQGQSEDGTLIHYAGFERSEDEVVSSERIRPYAPEMHAVGTAVDVRWHGAWFPAVVLEARLGIHRIHYEGFGDVWDEWVARERIRSRRT